MCVCVRVRACVFVCVRTQAPRHREERKGGSSVGVVCDHPEDQILLDYAARVAGDHLYTELPEGGL